jgi:acetolactate synthase regulatory subunit
MSGSGLLVRVHDRPGSLERVLGLARRRAMSLKTESVVRSADGHWSVMFQCTADEAPVDHYANEFRELLDLVVALPLRFSPQSEEPIP